MLLRLLMLATLWALVGCSLEVGRAGASCRRSSQCQAGLGCVRGKCSRDLRPIADKSTVPSLNNAAATAADAGTAAPALNGEAGRSAADSGG